MKPSPRPSHGADLNMKTSQFGEEVESCCNYRDKIDDLHRLFYDDRASLSVMCT